MFPGDVLADVALERVCILELEAIKEIGKRITLVCLKKMLRESRDVSYNVAPLLGPP